MKVYLAAAWSRRKEILAVAEELIEAGVEVTSRWLWEETSLQKEARLGNKERDLRERCYYDLADVDAADILVRFTDPETQNRGNIYDDKSGDKVDVRLLSAARMVEWGYAMAKGKSLITVGGKQCVFDRKDGIVHLEDADALVDHLSPLSFMQR